MEKVLNMIRDNNATGTLFVVKGFDIEICGGDRVNLADVIANKVGRLFSLATKECQVISFEEFISLFDMIILQYKKVIILENPEYINLYPINVIINDDVSNSLLAHFDDEVGGDTELVEISEYTFIYSNYVTTDAGIACCYNIGDSLLKSEKIERIVIKDTEEKELEELQLDSVPEDYYNICNDVDYYQLVCGLKNTDQSFIVAWESYIAGKETISAALRYLNGLYDHRIKSIAISGISIESSVHNPEIFEIMEKYWGIKHFDHLKYMIWLIWRRVRKKLYPFLRKR